MHAPRSPTCAVVTLSQRPDSVAHLLQTCFHLRRNERLREEVCFISICLHLCTLRHYAIRADLGSFRGCLEFCHTVIVGPAVFVEQISFQFSRFEINVGYRGYGRRSEHTETSRNNLLSCEHANNRHVFQVVQSSGTLHIPIAAAGTSAQA